MPFSLHFGILKGAPGFTFSGTSFVHFTAADDSLVGHASFQICMEPSCLDLPAGTTIRVPVELSGTIIPNGSNPTITSLLVRDRTGSTTTGQPVQAETRQGVDDDGADANDEAKDDANDEWVIVKNKEEEEEESTETTSSDEMSLGEEKKAQQKCEKEEAEDRAADLAEEELGSIIGDEEVEEEEEESSLPTYNEGLSGDDLSAKMAGIKLTMDYLDRSKTSAELDAKVGVIKINDPDDLMFGVETPRQICFVRTTIPASIDPSTFKGSRGPNKAIIKYEANKDKATYDASHTLGPVLCHLKELVTALQSSCDEAYHVDVADQTNKDSVSKKWFVHLKLNVERHPRNPLRAWSKCPPGHGGYFVISEQTRSTFFYNFFMAEEDESMIRPRDQLAGDIDVQYQQGGSNLSAEAMARNRMDHVNRFNSPPRGNANARTTDRTDQSTSPPGVDTDGDANMDQASATGKRNRTSNNKTNTTNRTPPFGKGRFPKSKPAGKQQGIPHYVPQDDNVGGPSVQTVGSDDSFYSAASKGVSFGPKTTAQADGGLGGFSYQSAAHAAPFNHRKGPPGPVPPAAAGPKTTGEDDEDL